MATDETSEDIGDLRDLLRGWRAELAAFARETLWRGEPDQTVVEFASDGVAVARRTAGGENEIVRLPGGEGLALAVARQQSGLFARDVMLRLPQSEVLRATVWLPSASSWTLRKALHFELERLSPVDPGQLYFDFETMGRDKAANKLELALRIVRRQPVDDAVRACHAAGLAVAAIAFAGDPRAADWQQFPVDRPAFARLVWRKWNLAFLAGLAVLLALAALMAWYGRNAEAQDMLSDQIALESRRAAIVERIEHDIAQTTARIGFLARQKQAPLTVGVLANLARILPDGTWLNEVEIGGGRAHIRGYSHGAADLIGAIDRSGVFSNAQFGAPLIRNPTGNVEQFDITLDLRGAKR
jgi:general secretion pathway protein L